MKRVPRWELARRDIRKVKFLKGRYGSNISYPLSLTPSGKLREEALRHSFRDRQDAEAEAEALGPVELLREQGK